MSECEFSHLTRLVVLEFIKCLFSDTTILIFLCWGATYEILLQIPNLDFSFIKMKMSS